MVEYPAEELIRSMTDEELKAYRESLRVTQQLTKAALEVVFDEMLKRNQNNLGQEGWYTDWGFVPKK